jgi:multidrug efflux system outer membrane protein
LLDTPDDEVVPSIDSVGGETLQRHLADPNLVPGQLITWPAFVDSEQLPELIEEALANNHDLQATAARWLATVEQAKVAAGPRWPALSANIERSRQKNEGNAAAPDAVNDSATASLSISWEVDLWGGVALGAKSALNNALRQEELLLWSRYSLAAQLSKTWLDALEAKQQWQLAEAREGNLRSNLDVIEDGFLSGIRDALDVYTSRAEFANSQSNTLLREQNYRRLARLLMVLLGRYPDAEIALQEDNPELTVPLVEGLSLSLLERRPDIKASAHALIAQQASLGMATAARLPALTLRGSYGASEERLGEVLSGDDLFWNAIGGLSAPLFRGGQLAAGQRRQKALLEAALEDYKGTVLNAILEVEQTLDNEQLLLQQLQAGHRANDVSRVAEEQAFESYVAGLSNLNTWLLAQRTAFSRKGELLQLQTNLLKNRIDLYLALAGDFGA